MLPRWGNNICLCLCDSQHIQCWSKLDFETFSSLLNWSSFKGMKGWHKCHDLNLFLEFKLVRQVIAMVSWQPHNLTTKFKSRITDFMYIGLYIVLLWWFDFKQYQHIRPEQQQWLHLSLLFVCSFYDNNKTLKTKAKSFVTVISQTNNSQLKNLHTEICIPITSIHWSAARPHVLLILQIG